MISACMQGIMPFSKGLWWFSNMEIYLTFLIRWIDKLSKFKLTFSKIITSYM